MTFTSSLSLTSLPGSFLGVLRAYLVSLRETRTSIDSLWHLSQGGRTEQHYRSRARSSGVRFACLRMDLKVPLASSRCIGTMTINTSSARRLFSLTWLPLRPTMANPIFVRILTISRLEITGSLLKSAQLRLSDHGSIVNFGDFRVFVLKVEPDGFPKILQG